jgi:hypothetical protein
MIRRAILAALVAVLSLPACAQRAKTVGELVAVLQSYPQDAPVAVGVGAYKGASVGVNLQDMTRDGRRGWFDRHKDGSKEAVVLIHETAGSPPDGACEVQIAEACSPLCHETKGCCQVDDTRWARLTLGGACGALPQDDSDWQIRPAPGTAWPTHTAQAFNFSNEPGLGYFRGECGDYLVRGRAPDTGMWSDEIPIHLPAPPCDSAPVEACRVELEQVKPPIGPPLYWVKATYHGECIDPNGRQYPYWPAPRWSLDGNASVGAQPWGADSYIAYIWPEVPGTYTIRATAPVSVSAEIEVMIP